MIQDSLVFMLDSAQVSDSIQVSSLLLSKLDSAKEISAPQVLEHQVISSIQLPILPEWFIFHFSFANLLVAILILFIGYTISQLLTLSFRKIEKKSPFLTQWIERIIPVIRAILWMTSVFFASLQLVTISNLGWVILLIPMTIVLVISSREIIRDLLSGIMISVNKIVKRNDRVSVGDIKGIVMKTGLLHVIILSDNHQVHVVPNYDFIRQVITLLSPNGDYSFINMDISFPWDVDAHTAKQLIFEAVISSSFCSLEYKPIVMPLVADQMGQYGKYRVEAAAISADLAEALKGQILENLSRYQKNIQFS